MLQEINDGTNTPFLRRNLDTGKRKRTLYDTTDDNLTLALSPDGKQLAVLSAHNENTRILKIIIHYGKHRKIIIHSDMMILVTLA